MEELSVAVVAESLWHGVPGGTGRVTRELIGALGRLPGVSVTSVTARHRGHESAVGVSGDAAQWVLPRVLLYESWSRFGGRPGSERVAPTADVVHSPMLPAPRRGDRPLIVTLHDLAFIDYPDAFPQRARRLYDRMWMRLRGEADRIICSSETTRRAAIAAGLAPERARVVPLAASVPVVESSNRSSALDRHQISGRYVLFVGTAEPRKNLSRLVAAYACSTLPAENIELVIVGPSGWREHLSDRIDSLPVAVKSRIRSLGEVSELDLHSLYSAAEVFCYPSLLEGFGLPVLEAMAHGTPVISSIDTSMAEIIGSAGVLVDPLDVDDLAAALDALCGDPGRRSAMGIEGTTLAAAFTWERHAERTVDVYREVLQ